MSYLDQNNLSVKGVGSSEDAIASIRSELPDVVLLDVVLPGQSGFELCRELKTSELTKQIPVVICSSKGTAADKLWGSMLGADAYLTKPIDPEALSATIKKWMV